MNIETEKPWQRFESSVMDGIFVLTDCRSRELPFALMIDAIHPGKHGGRIVAPTLKEAKWSIRNAVHEFQQAVKEPDKALIFVAMGVLHCLFAIRCLNRQSPVAGLIDVPTDIPAAILALEACGSAKDETAALKNVVSGLAQLAALFPNDDRAAERMQTVRSWAWSSYTPGIVMYVDLDDPKPQIIQREMFQARQT